MNNIIIFSNTDTCPAGTNKLSENVMFMDKTIDPRLFKKTDDHYFAQTFNNNNVQWDFQHDMDPRVLSLCQYPPDTKETQIPAGSYFTIKNNTCPAKSTKVGKIGILNLVEQNNGRFKNKSYIKTVGEPYYNYVWNLPTLCHAKSNIDITDNIVLPATYCDSKHWKDVGTYGMMGSVFDYSFAEGTGQTLGNNINIDPIHNFLPDQRIIIPRMCTGDNTTNKTIKKCLAKTDNIEPMVCNKKKNYCIPVESYADQLYLNSQHTNPDCAGRTEGPEDNIEWELRFPHAGYKNTCDEEMRDICRMSEYADTNICSCINSNMKLVGNPLYIDNTCIEHGYKTYEMKKNALNFFQKSGLANCDELDKYMAEHPKAQILRNRFTNHCFDIKTEDPVIVVPAIPQVRSYYYIIIALIIFGLLVIVISVILFIRSRRRQ